VERNDALMEGLNHPKVYFQLLIWNMLLNNNYCTSVIASESYSIHDYTACNVQYTAAVLKFMFENYQFMHHTAVYFN